ncbi:PadR family transcriptional regulator [Stella sp.]|uniref:PadR family transcriptional regulator n=1 Tax=Stella sp. TaxID=2912054 RepID=UPI0035B073D1
MHYDHVHTDHHGRGRGQGRDFGPDHRHAMRGPRRGGDGFAGDRGGPGHGHGRGRGGRDGGRRALDSGDLRLVLLHLLEGEARHGYDLIREIETRTGGAYAPSPGVVYPTLSVLDELGHIAEARTEGTRRSFSLTEDGRAHLDAHRAEAEAALARLDALGRDRDRLDTGPVSRAMANLHTVLRDRLAGEAVGRETLLDVAAILDEAAQKIERL